MVPALIMLLAGLLSARAAAAQDAVVPPVPRPAPARISQDAICATLRQAAAENGLPQAFFTRLIWQESRFNPEAVSRAGAQGIAQFMPGTAAWRGLLDPFHPLAALRESASYLRELLVTHGNLGLAAAAYNAGPGRVAEWRAGRGGLPSETRAYVRIITGRPVDDWAVPAPPDWAESELPPGVPCSELGPMIAAAPAPRPERNPAWGPWGVQLAGNWSEGKVLASYERLRRSHAAILRDRFPLVLRSRTAGRGSAARHLIRIAENSRAEADRLCAQLQASGGHCIVLRNPAAARTAIR
jgi:hypothetical protein